MRDDGGAEPVAGWPHECVVAQCRVSERQTRVRSVPAAGGSGRGPDHQRPVDYGISISSLNDSNKLEKHRAEP